MSETFTESMCGKPGCGRSNGLAGWVIYQTKLGPRCSEHLEEKATP